jgi:hypothetical protein
MTACAHIDPATYLPVSPSVVSVPRHDVPGWSNVTLERDAVATDIAEIRCGDPNTASGDVQGDTDARQGCLQALGGELDPDGNPLPTPDR